MTLRRAIKTAMDDGSKPYLTLMDKCDECDQSEVTVTISLYNYRDHILPCLESIASQTLQPVDLIIVDDCSTDGSVTPVSQWLREKGARFNNYLFLQHRQNEGLGAVRNTAFVNAKTPFAFVLDADNTIYPRCLESLLEALRNCDASFAYCYLEKFGEATGIENTKPWNPLALQYGNFIDAMVLHRTATWRRAGGYATDMPVMGWEDFDLWFRIAAMGGWGVQVPEILARYRVSRLSMLNSVTNYNADKLWAYLRMKYPEAFTR